ncbi:MAG TPA: SRPBCC domain-containing protein [Actinomycetota bacterium]|nr:SRPBCC domain-containing protein [Actinomycetota bacterium]
MDRVNRRIELPAPPAEVWSALTEGISEWFGAEADLRPERGSRATFRWPDGRERGAVVEAVEPERLLTFRWLPFERVSGGGTAMVGPGRVELAIAPSGRATVLSVTEWVAAPAREAEGALG